MYKAYRITDTRIQNSVYPLSAKSRKEFAVEFARKGIPAQYSTPLSCMEMGLDTQTGMGTGIGNGNFMKFKDGFRC